MRSEDFADRFRAMYWAHPIWMSLGLIAWLLCLLGIAVSGGGFFVHQTKPFFTTYELRDVVRNIDNAMVEEAGDHDALTVCFDGYPAEREDEPGKYQVQMRLSSADWENKRRVISRSEIQQGCALAADGRSIPHDGFVNSETEPSFVECTSYKKFSSGEGYLQFGCYKNPRRSSERLPVYLEHPEKRQKIVANRASFVLRPLAWLIDLVTAPVQVLIGFLLLMMWSGGVPAMP